MTEKSDTNYPKNNSAKSFQEFLLQQPPGQKMLVKDLATPGKPAGSSENVSFLRAPDLELHCGSPSCEGIRIFRPKDGHRQFLSSESLNYVYLTYKCSNCQQSIKTYSLMLELSQGGNRNGDAYKFGEFPNFGPPIHSQLNKLINPDRELFMKGRRCEIQGLGVGAFVYYRRVVEEQKNRILKEITKVSEKIGAPNEKIDKLKAAQSETQFTKSLKLAKDAIPESLLIDGHNPILLLHNALSKGVHAMSDDQCLEIASSVRMVLSELSERLSAALKDEEKLSKALSTLMHS